MPNSLRIWLIALIFVLLGLIAKSIATYSYTTEFILKKEATIDIPSFRFLQGNLDISLNFKHKDNETLGNYKGIEKNGYTSFINPGEPIQLLVKDTYQNVLYEAMPASSGTWRSMVPYIDDNDPSIFPGFYSSTERFLVNSGFSEFKIEVINIGKSIEGKKIILKISSPMPSYKVVSYKSLYACLWFFYLWPLWFLFLFFSYKYIIKTIPNSLNNSSNTVQILNHSVHHLLLVPGLSVFILLFLLPKLEILAILIIVIIVIIHCITMPYILQKKYPLYNNLQKSIAWFTWTIVAISIFFFLAIPLQRFIL